MDLQQVEKLLIEQNRLIRETQRHVQYVLVALALIAVVVVATMVLAWRTYSENVAPAVEGMQTTMNEVHSMTVQTAALLEEAKQTMAEVRRATGAAAPMVEEAQQTIQQARETTERVQAPLNILRGIPVLNWFIQ